jgi:hypothetical protein
VVGLTRSSAAIAPWILPRSIGILREAAHILLEGAPAEVDMPLLRRRILDLPGVEAIHDLHCWTLTSGLHSASVHIRAAAGATRSEVLAEVQRVLREGAGVEHATPGRAGRGGRVSRHPRARVRSRRRRRAHRKARRPGAATEAPR